jgi:hypothetical protein
VWKDRKAVDEKKISRSIPLQGSTGHLMKEDWENRHNSVLPAEEEEKGFTDAAQGTRFMRPLAPSDLPVAETLIVALDEIVDARGWLEETVEHLPEINHRHIQALVHCGYIQTQIQAIRALFSEEIAQWERRRAWTVQQPLFQEEEHETIDPSDEE